jgi:hypothetical protein
MTDTSKVKRRGANVEELDPHDDVVIDDDEDVDDEETKPYRKPRDSGAIDTKGYLTNFELGEE